MVKVTRSGRKFKDEDSDNSRRKQMLGSTTDTSSEKQSASSSSSTRKSERLEKFSPQTPSSKKKSVLVENQTMPQLRRSDRNKNKKAKREESDQKNIKAGVYTSKTRNDLKPVRVISKKKRLLDARRYGELLKPQRSKAKEPDLKGHGDSETIGDSSSKEVEDEPECSDGKVEELREDDLGEDDKTATEGSGSGSGLKEVEDEGECSEGKIEEMGGRHFGQGGYKRAIKGTSSGCKEAEDEGECNEGTVEEVREKKCGKKTIGGSGGEESILDAKEVKLLDGEGASDTPADNGSQLLPMSTDNIDAVCLPSVDSEVTETHMVESEERKHLGSSQKNLHLFLKAEISKLCDILRLSEDIKSVTGKFLEYIMNNHKVSREPATVLQAFQISVCWTAASLLNQKINRKETLILAKQHLNFEFNDEEAEIVYSRVRKLKKVFSRRAENAMESENPGRTKDNAEHPVHARDSQLAAASDQPVLEGEIRENFQSPHCSGQQQMSAKQELVTDSKQVSGSPKYFLKTTGQVEKIHLARMRKLDDEQKAEIAKFNENNSEMREKLIARLEKEHKIESTLIRAVHSQISVRIDKLKIVDRNFARKRKMEELSSRIEKQQKRLKAMQLAARIEEKKRKLHWLEEAKSGRPVAEFSMLPLPDFEFRLEDMESDEARS